MTPADSQQLLAAWLAGELEAEGTHQLLELCRQDSAFREEVARHKSFDRLIHAAAIAGTDDAFLDELAVRCGVRDSGGSDLANAVRWRVHWPRWAVAAAAACLMFGGGWLAWSWSRPVAVIESLTSVRWADGQRPADIEDGISRGRMKVAEGFVALRFSRGARLLVEGPAELDIRSADLVRIESGKAFAHVPESAIGFTIEGPTGRVVDKGTDFAVNVAASSMEVHVLKGLVEAGRGSTLQPLRENEALQISAKTVSTIPMDSGQFLTNAPPSPHRPIGWVHWAFDENAGQATQARTAGLGPIERSAQLTALNPGSAGPQWTTGQFGSALSFDGEDDYVQTEFPGISGDAPRTVAFWVKVPTDFRVKNGYALVCWGSTVEEGEAWQISVNPKAEIGELGRLRVGRIGEPIIGTTDLRDDRWHHVAVVFYGGGHADDATQVLMYVDGQLERTHRKSMPIVHTDIDSPASKKVAFGLNIGPVGKYPGKPPEWLVFRGCMDEVFICDGALSQAQVRDLMTRNYTDAFMPPTR
jgi:ferric-dicitrate binding protein FerR (iron transport regulator)